MDNKDNKSNEYKDNIEILNYNNEIEKEYEEEIEAIEEEIEKEAKKKFLKIIKLKKKNKTVIAQNTTENSYNSSEELDSSTL
ncbi:11718_t:CDS:2 [Scutellospora calospora]|uniref:11718_t:CDS:1 n=1 Tax=Scutellospora calospora TaxID=85575 RepID=A0ACA9LWK7_9GLOM|nr:11718_t:CDS:2 [Scutellospora calospora]